MINRPLTISIALLISIASAHGAELKPAISIKKPGRIERVYDWSCAWVKTKKENHPKLWNTLALSGKAASGALGIVSIAMGFKK